MRGHSLPVSTALLLFQTASLETAADSVADEKEALFNAALGGDLSTVKEILERGNVGGMRAEVQGDATPSNFSLS